MSTLHKYDEKCSHWRKLSSEKFLSFKKRFIISAIIASTFYLVVIRLIVPGMIFLWGAYIFTILDFFLFTEILFFYDRLISKYYPWTSFLKKRVVALFVFGIVLFFVFNYILPLLQPIFVENIIEDEAVYRLTFIISILYMLIYVMVIIAYNFHETLKYFVYENEKLKQDKLISDYRVLQDQLNPHFLFNNLSTLIAIIKSDKDKAVTFAENFTDVYRYVLSKEGQVAVTVKEELEFLKSYVQLHKERVGEGLQIKVDVNEEIVNKKIPHLSLQVLIENAVKHNITSRSKPLTISIGVINGWLYVQNNKQLKESTYSTNTGLANLGKRLKILTDEEIVVESTDSIYRVEVPLID